ncbi:GHKL domain-containing protein [Paenibacillus sp. M1]|uniref:GHKL domain-containing protein n=1 Tax=Paenibacillus haidiansis TaxID=1574488 RepID=A0ABU7VNS9_9BACL
MTLLNNGLFIVNTLLQLFLLRCYFTVLFHAPEKAGWWTGICYFVAGCLLFASSAVAFPVLLTGLVSVTSSFLISLLYSARIQTRIVFSLLFLLMGAAAELLSYYLFSWFRSLEHAVTLNELEGRQLVLFASTCLMLLFILILRYIKRKGADYKLNGHYYFMLGLMLLFSLIILNTLFFYTQRNWLSILSAIGILSINLLIFFLFDSVMEQNRLREENNQLQKQMDYQDHTYAKTAHSFRSIKRIIHDTKKQLVYIRACILKQKSEEAVRHINQILDATNNAYLRIETGNLVVDALVSHALNMAQDNNIAVKYDIRIVAEAIKLDRYDLCVVIGNVLDNAIEAASVVPSQEERFINLFMSTNTQAFFVRVLNSRQDRTRERAQDFGKHPDYHGLGLTNIQRIAKKYGGYLKTKAEAKCYETIVVLPFADT